jgi:hypothetical protein
LSASASRPALRLLATALDRLAGWWRRRNVANALDFEELGGALSVFSVRLGLADADRPAWARAYLRLWGAAYLKYGIALPVPRILRRDGPR